MSGRSGWSASFGAGAGSFFACLLLQGACVRARTSALPSDQPRAHVEPDLIGRHHTVAPGETLFRLAQAYGISAEALAAANGIQDPRALAVGQDLVIPDTDSADHWKREAPELRSAQSKPSSVLRGRAPTSDPSVRGELQWPLRGVLYSRFGRKGREVHDGIDLAAPLGTPIKAASAGTVLYAGEQKGYGLIAIIEHANGLSTLYAHNRDVRVRTGQQVREGQVIATVGESGRTTGPHLHFEVRRDGLPVDPLDHLGPIPR